MNSANNQQIDWSKIESCFYYIENFDKEKPMISFDYDDTLCKKFTSQMLDNVKSTILNLNKSYNICIFTNQMGISKGKTTHQEIRSRFETFIKSLYTSECTLNLQIFYSSEDDNYRKPMVGMFDLMYKLLNPYDIKYYCGDAGGRKGDFSCSDLYFANNCKIEFKTPEEVFNNETPSTSLCSKQLKSLQLYSDDKWKNGRLDNLRELFKYYSPDLVDKQIKIDTDLKNLIIFIGPQGCGKSTMTNYLSKKYNFSIINGDLQKTKTNMKKMFKKYQNSEDISGIIIDNTTPTQESRKEWINLLENKEKWHISIIYINVDKLISFHLTKYRQCFTGFKIPSVAIHSYYKKLEIPSQEEGNVIVIDKPIINYEYKNYFRFN